ncbi:endonuclease domain-containing protein [Agromyces atrinae]|uniref:DUF559 domain-containing protein n=1 Tax=Agromyces atrinae TaxID=592376 RepID=A0A4Q2M5X6_9MICO|nr:hypothetical protein [Agromyces atrinae]NYD66985.1 hypothetical protein [Agromyces atrinae]RXZ85281.1 hypothetical protein ESP50_16370 [Agromyces atrinae]RXZ85389.1 hypothetical protein ESP50_15775 [Agromyces atrinae]
MSHLTSIVSRAGEVVHVRQLQHAGVRRRAILAAIERGELIRIRVGWYASPRADVDQWKAVLAGGALGCVSALARDGVWSGIGRDLHVSVSRAAHPRLMTSAPGGVRVPVWGPRASADVRRNRSVRLSTGEMPTVHRHEGGIPLGHPTWAVPAPIALAQALRCQTSEHALAVLDSIIREGVMARDEAIAVARRVPSVARLVATDPFIGIPESGVESIFLRRVAALGLSVRPQFRHPVGGRFDGIIEGCLAYEVDGFAHHASADAFAADHDRTLRSLAFGLPVIRVTARHVLADWPIVESAILRAVADARLLRDIRHLPPAG